MDKQMMWIVAVVIALLVGLFGGYSYAKAKVSNQMMMAQSDLQKQVDDLKMKNDQLMANPTQSNDSMMKAETQPSGSMMKTNTEPSDEMMQTSPKPSEAMMKK